MITPSFNITATERILPRLALDFTTASLDSRITLTRSGDTATRVNSAGAIEIVNANLPRFDYNPSTLAIRGLLIEETRINFLTSVDLVNPSSTTGWTKAGDAASVFSVVSDSTELTNAGLSGVCTSGNVYKLDNSAGTTNAFVRIDTAVSWGLTDVSLSSYARGSGVFRMETNVGTWTGSTNLTLGSTYSRFSVTGTTNTSSNQFRVRATAGSVVYFILVQAEVGSFATSVTLNTGTAVTRNADVAVMTGTNFSNWWTATNGATAVKYIPITVAGTRPVIEFDDGTANESIALRGNTTNPELYIVDGGADQVQIDAGTIAANTTYTLVGAWNTNDCAAAIGGGAAVTDNTATMPTVTQARLGSDGTNYLNGWLQTIRYWPQRITNAETQAFSK